MKQSAINKLWEQEFDSNVGVITLLACPYNLSLERKKIEKLFLELSFIKSLDKNLFQYPATLETRFNKKTAKLNIWFLGFKPGLLGDNRGITKGEWRKITNKITKILQKFGIGGMYIENWDDKKKFEARCEILITIK